MEVHDIFDGELYKKLSKEKEFNILHDFTYTISCDGAPISKSSTLQVWPIFLQLNEININLRHKNIITAGFWVCKSQNELDLQTMITFFAEKMNKLAEEGITWYFNGEIICSRFFPLLCIADAPARAKIQNIISHGGYYSCNWCEIQGLYCENGVKFLYSDRIQTRSQENVAVHAIEAAEISKPVMGVEGNSALNDLKFFDSVWGVPPDYMHCTLLGIVKSLLNLYMTSSNDLWYIGSPSNRSLIDKKLLAIKTPDCMNRKVRSISKWRLWKASEFGNFLLYYCVTCLNGILPKKYFQHILEFRAAILLLMKKSISTSDLKLADDALHEFVCQYQLLYGQCHMNYNVHVLLHLCDAVLKCGPLWVFSAFPFENNLRLFRSLLTGTKVPAKQIAKKMSIINFLNFKTNDFGNPKVQSFCNNLYSNVFETYPKSFNENCNFSVDDGVEILISSDLLSVKEKAALQYVQCPYKLKLHYKLKINFFKVCTSIGKVYDNCVILKDGSVGRISKILSFHNAENCVYILFEKIMCETLCYNTLYKSMCQNNNELVCILPEMIKAPCISAETENQTYLTPLELPFAF